ncbi:hypothetical protein R3P38DRAFT_2810298 [Favolaschia claudopus]|uniref:Uncharacterized protein n=1 Tax=Favolaschia claudopus TaxID=2862362 RepID=A0AAV9ZBS5_9AGAR
MTRQLGSYGKYLAHIQAAFQGAFRRGDCCIVKYPEQTFSAIGGHCQPRRTDSGQEVFTGAGNNIAGVPLSQLSHSDQVAEAVAWAAESAGSDWKIPDRSHQRPDSEDEDSQDEFKMPRDDEEEEKEEEENEDEDVIMEGAEFTDGRPAVNPVFGDPGLLSFLQLECDKNHAALLQQQCEPCYTDTLGNRVRSLHTGGSGAEGDASSEKPECKVNCRCPGSRELRVYGTNPLNSSIEFAGFKFNDVRLSEGILVNMHAIHQVVIRGNIPQHERDEREAVEQAMNSGHSTAKIERQ